MGVEHTSITNLARRLGRVPAGLRKELRPKLRAGAGSIKSDMQDRASWSTRIPAAIRTSDSGSGVQISVDSAPAPHARPYEGHGNSTFVHPVFGDREVLVTQSTRPFFYPAVKAGKDQLKRKISEAVAATLRGIAS